MNKHTKTIIISLVLIALSVVLTGCSSSYDRTETELVQATLTNKHYYTTWVGKLITHHYQVKFEYEDLNKTIDSKSLYDWLEEGNQITMRKTTYYKENEIVKTELELIK